MFFSKAGVYKPCGIFTIGHLCLVILNVFGVIYSLYKTKNKSKEEVKEIIKGSTILVLIMEFFIILFKLLTGDPKNLNNYVPLYFCSMLLYAGCLSSFCKGKLKRVGDVFLSTGAVIGGIVFLILPTTSLPSYPAFHLVSVHSFLYHGIMIYLGLLVNVTNYIKLNKTDVFYYASLVLILCLIALGLNNTFDSNLMFISKDFPSTPITILYKISGPYFTLLMILGQMFLPYYLMYGIIKLKDKFCINK